MKRFLLIFLNILYLGYSQTFPYQREWATYFGDHKTQIHAVLVDEQGNFYIAGFVEDVPENDQNFIFSNYTNSNSYQENFGGGQDDGILAKISPEGEVFWATFLGGEDNDVIRGMVWDQEGNLTIMGVTRSLTGISTPNAYQTQNAGMKDIFLSKFTTDGNIIWSTYFGGAGDDGDVASISATSNQGAGIFVSEENEIFIYYEHGTSASTNAYQLEPANSSFAKFSSNGTPLWNTFYGINLSEITSVVANETGIYVAGSVYEDIFGNNPNSYFDTTGTHVPDPLDHWDFFFSKFSIDGQQRIWSKYLGGNLPERSFCYSLVELNKYYYLTGFTRSDAIATPESYNDNLENNAAGSTFIMKIDENSNIIWATYLEETVQDINNTNLRAIQTDGTEYIYVSGSTFFEQYISTPGAYQETVAGLSDDFIVKFNEEGELIWGTYYGGSGYELKLPLIALYNDDTFYFASKAGAGSTEGITTPNSLQPNPHDNFYLGGSSYIVKFGPEPLNTNEVELPNNTTFYPNPAKEFVRVKSGKNIEEYSIYSAVGSLLVEKKINKTKELEISTKQLNKGVYFIQVQFEDGKTVTHKLLKE